MFLYFSRLPIWLFPKIRGPILVAPIIRTIIYLGLFWGPLFMEAPVSALLLRQVTTQRPLREHSSRTDQKPQKPNLTRSRRRLLESPVQKSQKNPTFRIQSTQFEVFRVSIFVLVPALWLLDSYHRATRPISPAARKA